MPTSPAPAHPDADLLRDLQGKLEAALGEALGGARQVALLNFPNHNNPGDSAIWLGARAALRRLGVQVVYQSAWNSFNAGALARNLPEGPILLNGGGNFGDLYGGQQSLRERVLRTQRGRHIIQLPQSIHFSSPQRLATVQKLIADHGNVTLILREQRSFDFATAKFAARTILSPDCAFGLGSLPRPTADPVATVMWLHRLADDPEFVDRGDIFSDAWLAQHAPGGSVLDIEWLRRQNPEYAWTFSQRLARSVNRRLLARAAAQKRWAYRAWRPLSWTFAPLGWGFVDRGLDILNRAEVLVTDKLHGHVMALLAGIEHVVLDNSYGKVSGTFQAWTHGARLAHWANSGDEAEELAAGILARRRL